MMETLSIVLCLRKYLLSKQLLDRVIEMITSEVDRLHEKEERGRSLLVNLSAMGPKPMSPSILLGLCKLLRNCLSAASNDILKSNSQHVQRLVQAFLRTQVFHLVLKWFVIPCPCKKYKILIFTHKWNFHMCRMGARTHPTPFFQNFLESLILLEHCTYLDHLSIIFRSKSNFESKN